MIEEALHEARRIERNELMQHALRQPLFGDRRGSDRARGDENHEILQPQPFDQRHRGKHFADACAMNPNQRARRPPQARFPAALRKSLGMLFAARQPSRQNLRRYRRSKNGRPAIQAQRQRETIRHD